MKAFLLAAGLGTRLRPITDTTPKCLVEIAGRPLLDIWLDALAKAGVHEVLVNTHHLAAQVDAHVARSVDASGRAAQSRASTARQRRHPAVPIGISSRTRTCSW